MRPKSKNGFTIVELVIVIAIIAILASVLIPTFTTVLDKANQSAALQDAKNGIQTVSALRNGVMGNIKVQSGKYVFYYQDKEGVTGKCNKYATEKEAIEAALTGATQQHSLQCIYYYHTNKDWCEVEEPVDRESTDTDELHKYTLNDDIPPHVLVVTYE